MIASGRAFCSALPLISFLAFCLSAKGAQALPEPLVSLTHTEEGIRIEVLLCGDDAFGWGWFSFFHPDGTTLCTRGTSLYPPQTTRIVIHRTHAPVMLPRPWRLVDGSDRLLLYDGSTSFPEGSDETGTVLSAENEGYYTDEHGNIRAPRFIYQKERWESVTPLRELFRLEILPEQHFRITIVTSSPLTMPETSGRFLGITARHITIREQKQHLLIAEGDGLTAATVPRLRFTREGDTFGRYLIEIRGQNESPAPRKEHRYPGRTITARVEILGKGTFRFEASALADSIPPSEESDFLFFMEKYVPKRYEVDK